MRSSLRARLTTGGLLVAFVGALAAAGACGTSNGATFGAGSDAGFECPDGDGCDAGLVGSDGPGSGSGSGSGSGGDTGVCPDPPCNVGDGEAPDGSGPLDAASDGPEAGPPPTSVVFVNAARDLPDLRFCWAIGKHGPSTTARPFPFASPAPESNYPAVPVGGAAILGDATELVSQSFTLWAVDAQLLASLEQGRTTPYSCAEALGGGDAGLPPTHFWELTGNAVLTRQTTTVLTITGCARAAADASAAACGGNWTGKGNVAASELALPAVAAASGGQLPVATTQLSPALALLLGDGGTASVTFGAEDAGVLVGTLGAGGGLSPSGSWRVVDAGTSGYGQLGFRVTAPKANLWMSLEQSLVLLAPTEDPTLFYGQPTSFLVAVVGDPNELAAYGPGAVATPDGTQLHLLVLALPAPQ